MKASIEQENRRDLRILLFVLPIMGVAMGLLNWMTNYFSDDYVLAFTFDASCLNYDKPIKSIGDIIYSQYYHYLFQHGRVVTEGIVQYLMSLRNKHVFDVLNSVLFVVYLYLLQLHSGRFTWVGTVFAAAMTFVFTRAFGEVFLWLSGSVNYLWVACLTLLLLFVFEKKQNGGSWLSGVCYGLVAFIVGSMQEGFSVGISAALGLSILWQWKNHKLCAVVPVCVMVGYMAGTLFDFLSPGIWMRARGNGINQSYNIRSLLDGIVYVLAGLRVFWIVVVVALIQSLRQRIVFRDLLRRNSLFLSAMLFQALFLMILGRAAEPRSLFVIEMFALIILLQLVPVQSVRLGIVSVVALIFIYVHALRINWKNYQTTQTFLEELATSEDGTVFFDVPHYSRSEKHYLGSCIKWNHHRSLFLPDAVFYGKKDGFLVLPKRFKDELYFTSSYIQPQNYYRDGEYSSNDISFVVKPLPKDIQMPPSVSDSINGYSEFVSFPSGNYLLKNKLQAKRRNP